MSSTEFILPHIMPPALVVALMYGLQEQQLLHATTTALLICTGFLAVLVPDMDNLQDYPYALLQCIASAFLVGFTVYSWFEQNISACVMLIGYVVLYLLIQAPRNIKFDVIVQELHYGYEFVIFWTCSDMAFRSDPVIDDLKVALTIAIGISLRPKAHPRRLLVLAAWNIQQAYKAILLWQGIQSSHASYPRFMVRSDEHPNPWAPAVLGATLGSILSGTIAVLLWYFGPRARDQQHAGDVEALGVQTNRAGPVTELHRQEREAATVLAMGESSEAQQAPGTEMNDIPPTSIDAGIQGPRPFPCAHLPRPRISVDEETEEDRPFPCAHSPRPRISVDEET